MQTKPLYHYWNKLSSERKIKNYLEYITLNTLGRIVPKSINRSLVPFIILSSIPLGSFGAFLILLSFVSGYIKPGPKLRNISSTLSICIENTFHILLETLLISISVTSLLIVPFVVGVLAREEVGLRINVKNVALLIASVPFVLLLSYALSSASKIASVYSFSIAFLLSALLLGFYYPKHQEVASVGALGLLLILLIALTHTVPFVLSLEEYLSNRLSILLLVFLFAFSRLPIYASAYASSRASISLFSPALTLKADKFAVYATFITTVFLDVATITFFFTLPRTSLRYITTRIYGPIEATGAALEYIYPINYRIGPSVTVSQIQLVNAVVPVIYLATLLAAVIAFPGTTMYRSPPENPGGRIYYFIKVITTTKRRTVYTLIIAVVFLPITIVAFSPMIPELSSFFQKISTTALYVAITTEAKFRRDVRRITNESEYTSYISHEILKAISHRRKSLVIIGYSNIADNTISSGLHRDSFREFFRETDPIIVAKNDFTLAILLPSILIISDDHKSRSRRFGEYGYKEYNVLGDYFRIPTLVANPMARIYDVKSIIAESNAVLFLDPRESKRLMEKLITEHKPHEIAYIIRVSNTDTFARLLQRSNELMVFPIYFERIVGDRRYTILMKIVDKYESGKKNSPLFVFLDMSSGDEDIVYGKAFSFLINYAIFSEIPIVSIFGGERRWRLGRGSPR